MVDFPELTIEEQVICHLYGPPALWPADGSAVFHRLNFITMDTSSHMVSGTLAFLNNMQQMYFIDLTGIWKRNLYVGER